MGRIYSSKDRIIQYKHLVNSIATIMIYLDIAIQRLEMHVCLKLHGIIIIIIAIVKFKCMPCMLLSSCQSRALLWVLENRPNAESVRVEPMADISFVAWGGGYREFQVGAKFTNFVN